MENDATIQAQPAAEGLKKCARCHEAKPLSEFYERSGSPGRRQSYCKQCTKMVGKERHVRINGSKHADVADILDGLVEGLGPEHTGTIPPLKRRTALSAYSTRELLSELKKRGFRGHLEWVPPAPKPKVVDLSDID